MLGGSKTCEDCGESYQGGTDLSKYGCRCQRAMYTAAKANREALNDVQPEAPADGEPIGGRVQCENCWGFYNKGTNLRLYGCPCQKAKLEAVFAEPAAESKDEPKVVLGGSKTCEDCGESYHAGTDLSKYGCRCRKAMLAAAKANREALGDVQPEAPADGEPIGGRVQCEHCWGFYNKGTNLRLYGCPCQKAKLEAVFAEPAAESKGESASAESTGEAKPVLGGSKTCEDCGESYHAGTDLSKYGCRCRKAMLAAAKANREALGDVQPEAPADGEPIGGRVQCEHCWGFYNKGTNLRLYGCPCQKAKLEAVFAEPAAESKDEPKPLCGGPKTCEDCGESYHGGTDLSKYGCRCRKAMFTAAKANREALGDVQPEAPGDGEPIGGRVQCEYCWDFYHKGTYMRVYGCPCQKAKYAAVFAEPAEAECKDESKPVLCGGSKTCDDCGESYNAGTDLSKYGCRCRKAMFTAAKANREALGDVQPEGPADGEPIGGRVQCEQCWGFYNKGTNLRLYGCPCQKAKLEAVFSQPVASESKVEGYCDDLQCFNPRPCPIHQAASGCADSGFDGYTVYYWGGFSGRGQPLMAMLSDAGAKWQRKEDVCSENYCFACPMVRHGGFCLSQTIALMQWLGEELGFNHPPPLRHVATKLLADLSDLWNEVYEKRKSATSWDDIDAFCKDRGADWFATLDNAAAKFGTPGFFLGDKVSYVDFMLWHVVEVVKFLYGEARLAKLLSFAPRLQAIHANMNARPGLAAYAQTEPVLYSSCKFDGAMPMAD